MVRIAPLITAVLLCPGLQAQEGFGARIASVEETLERFYRGERLEIAVDRSVRGVEAYNARTRKVQADIEQRRHRLEQILAAGKEERSRLEELDRELKDLPQGSHQEAVQRKVEARNALVKKINEQMVRKRQDADDFNAFVKRTQEALERERTRVLAAQDAVNARLAAFETFTKSGQDSAFFVGLNRLLADVRRALRAAPGDPALEASLLRVRGFRRELAAWAEAGQALRPNGLVIVEARVEDEPCWFVVDTGAMDTIVSPEIVEAVGCADGLGRQTSLSVVGGLRVTGHACRIPRLQVGDRVLRDVAASAVLPSDVGIDGLLGQSFLKYFIYTIDERKPGKLFLSPR